MSKIRNGGGDLFYFVTCNLKMHKWKEKWHKSEIRTNVAINDECGQVIKNLKWGQLDGLYIYLVINIIEK